MEPILRNIHAVGDPLQVLTIAYMDKDHPVPDGFVMAEGEPPKDYTIVRVMSLADQLKKFLYDSLTQYQDKIDPVTEVRIRQLQKSLEPIPGEMDPIRFAIGVKPQIEAFDVPGDELVTGLKQAMIDMLDAVIP